MYLRKYTITIVFSIKLSVEIIKLSKGLLKIIFQKDVFFKLLFNLS